MQAPMFISVYSLQCKCSFEEMNLEWFFFFLLISYLTCGNNYSSGSYQCDHDSMNDLVFERVCNLQVV